MNIYEFGSENKKSLVLLHGACMSWDMFEDSIDLLKEYFHIYAIGIPGHDLNTDEEFSSVEEIASMIEDGLLESGVQAIDLLYGLSMGGGFVIRMLADNRLKVSKAIIDAGITPYELPYLLTRVILLRDFLLAQWGKHSRKALASAFPEDRYSKEGIDYMYQLMQHMSASTIWNVFNSTDNYSMPKQFPRIETEIFYWYGQREKRARKLDIAYVKKHIPGVRFREIADMDHGEYALMRPKDFVKDLLDLMEIETKRSKVLTM